MTGSELTGGTGGAGGADAWSTQQLAEFLAAVSGFPDEPSAQRGGVERVAEALDADAAALVVGSEVLSSTGFPAGQVPVRELVAIAQGGRSPLDLPGAGPCATAIAPLEERPGTLIVARGGGVGFDHDERVLLRGMARVLAMAMALLGMVEEERSLRRRSEAQAEENARLLASLRERRALLERLSSIQRSIVHRADLQTVLDAVVAGAADLLGDEMVSLQLVHPDDPQRLEVRAQRGIDAGLAAERREVGRGAGGRAVAEGRLVVSAAYGEDPLSLAAVAGAGVKAAMAAPVHENGRPTGALVVGTRSRGRSYGTAERQVLLAFAEHASLAITDARNFADALHQAFHDALTGLPNRLVFADRLEQALARSLRTQAPVAVLFVDLDSFKTVNDSLGHHAGDELLMAAAQRLERCLRPGDTVARLGGDEFALLLEDMTSESDAELVAKRILAELEVPFPLGGREVFISASIGISTARGRGEDLLRNADLAMYEAKGSGKGRYEVFQHALHTAVVERMELEMDLQRAIEREQFDLAFQPVVKLRTGRILAVEALLRWNHPVRGKVPPAAFIPLAEDTRLIVPIGRWVLRAACRQAVQWQATHPGLAVAVNVSGVQLRQPDLIPEFAEIIEETGIDPRSLILEITETVLTHDAGSVECLRRLKELGVQLAVDDFGTGYSSLQYLRRFPIDILKIAKPFVDGVGGASDESALARAIIDLGDSFQLRVVAEGIELADQLERLLELGCELGQGYHFAAPMDAERMGALLAEGILGRVP